MYFPDWKGARAMKNIVIFVDDKQGYKLVDSKDILVYMGKYVIWDFNRLLELLPGKCEMNMKYKYEKGIF